jgi:hypothetical protein
VLVLIVTFALTVFVDLSVAVQVGVVASSLLFMRRMAEVTNIEGVSGELSDAMCSPPRALCSASSAPCYRNVHTVFRPMHRVFRSVYAVFRLVHSVFRPVHAVFRPAHSVFRPVHAVFRPVHRVFRPVRAVFRPVHAVFRAVHAVFRSMHVAFRAGHVCFGLCTLRFALKMAPQRVKNRSRCTLLKHRQECLCHTRSRLHVHLAEYRQPLKWHHGTSQVHRNARTGRAGVAQTLLSVLVRLGTPDKLIHTHSTA